MQMETLCAALSENGVRFLEKEPLSAHCSFKIGGPAELFVTPATPEQLCKAVSLCKENGVPYYLLGKGSNILFADDGYAGAIIDCSTVAGRAELSDAGVLYAEAGIPLAQICVMAQKKGFTGLEFAYGIPGTVGGAIYMNAGAYGGEIKDVLHRVGVLCQNGEVIVRNAAELALSYRHSALEENGECVLWAEFQLAPGDSIAIQGKMEDLLSRRKEKQPLDKPSAGSTFKRPEGAFAAALIDQCGLRGYRVGDAAISEKHCGFVVNLGHATCAQVLQLCDEVSAIVQHKTGFVLEKEIRVV